MSEKIGRNDPCPCGSGKKFKKCCGGVAGIQIDLKPAELVLARVEAFRNKDFGFIYDSYHRESYFLEQFPDRAAYIQTGRSSLSADYRINNVEIIREKVGDSDGEWLVIFLLDTWNGTALERTYELSRFISTEKGWRYHSSQKLAANEVAVAAEEIDFSHFGAVSDKVWF